jgi:hypothetical protein
MKAPDCERITVNNLLQHVFNSKKIDVCLKSNFARMFRWLKESYEKYKEWVRVDLLMYALLILMVILYGIYKALTT